MFLPVLIGNGRGSAQPPPQNSSGSEVTINETQPAYTLRTERNLVLVRVVVRDRDGKPVSGLKREDFRLFDNGKPQTVSEFNIETSPAHIPVSPEQPNRSPNGSTVEVQVVPGASIPERFVGLFFDDVHLSFEDAVRTREAAKNYLKKDLHPSDRAGIFTSSGRLTQEFTSDQDLLEKTLDRLQPRPLTGDTQAAGTCPYLTPYQASQIYLQQPDAIQLAVLDIIDCQCGGQAENCPNASEQAQAFAMQAIQLDETQSRYSLRELENLVRHLAAMPGQRSIVFVSSGFLTDRLKFELSQITDRALRARVIINTLDSKGLFTPGLADDAATQSSSATAVQKTTLRTQFDRFELQLDADVMAQLASETGGIFFENSNDYEGGFHRTGGLAEIGYVLAFSPQDLKADGSFHKLKVTLANPSGMTIQARRGYFARRKSEDAASREKEDIEEAVFSREEMQELPLDVHTQFFKTDGMNAKLSVVAHIDLSSVRFAKQDGRNVDNMILVAAIFDHDGNYVTGTSETLAFHLRDTTLTKLSRSGISVKTSLGVKSGSYLMRVVVRDSESTRMAALSRTVEIPN